jgi:hypothetical protein
MLLVVLYRSIDRSHPNTRSCWAANGPLPESPDQALSSIEPPKALRPQPLLWEWGCSGGLFFLGHHEIGDDRRRYHASDRARVGFRKSCEV